MKYNYSYYNPMNYCSAVMALAGSISLANAASVVQAPPNNGPLQAQILNSSFSSGFVPEIMGSDNLFAEHATVQGTGNGQQAWYLFSHIGGDLIIDIDDTTIVAGNPTPALALGLFNALGQLIQTSAGQLVIDPGSSSLNDPFISIANADPVNYYVAVLAAGGTFGNGFVATGTGAPLSSNYDLNVTVPEPSSALLGLLGVSFIFGRRRR